MFAAPKPKSSPGLPVRVLRFLFFAVVALGTLIVLAYTMINLWGRLEWNKTKNELLAMGEPLSLSELLPPEIPDEDNFFATESWKKLAENEDALRSGKSTSEEYHERNPFGVLYVQEQSGPKKNLGTVAKRGSILGRESRLTDLAGFARAFQEKKIVSSAEGEPASVILLGLERARPLLTEIEEASGRPGAAFRYQIDSAKAFEVPLPHIFPFMNLAQVLSLRSVARMTSGDSRGAAQDILLILRLAEVIQSDPFLVSKMMRWSCISIAMNIFWEGTVIGTWSAQDLERVQRALEKFDPAEDFSNGLRAERGALNEWLSSRPSWKEFSRILKMFEGMGEKKGRIPELALSMYPFGLILEDQSSINWFIQKGIDALKDENVSAIVRLGAISPPASVWRHPLASMYSSDAIREIPLRSLRLRSHLDLTITACALERFRLRYGFFPASLDDLLPDFLATVPSDPVTRSSIGYHLVAPNDYELTCTVVESEMGGEPPDGKWIWNRLPPTSP